MQELSNREKYMMFLLNSCTEEEYLPKNKGLRNFFSRDLSAPEKSGLTKTFYEHLQIPELVLRLMDNRDLKSDFRIGFVGAKLFSFLLTFFFYQKNNPLRR